jgi:uncharacterized protein (TIGR03083 family)
MADVDMTEAQRQTWLADVRVANGHLLAAFAADPKADVEQCPGWDVAAVVRHVGQVQGRTARVVRERLDARAPRLEEPDDDGELATWFQAIADDLLEVLATTPLDAAMYTFVGPGTAAWWVERMGVETTVHAWDAARSAGVPFDIDPDLARRGVAELMRAFVPTHSQFRGTDAPRRGSLHLHRTDGDGEWLLVDGPDGAVVTEEHAKGDAALRATASDLLLVMWNRLDPAGLEHFGDPAVIRSWAIPF